MVLYLHVRKYNHKNKHMKKLFTLSLVLMVLTGCRINIVNNIQVDAAVTFELLKQEAYGGREKESTAVVTSQEQLQALYKELGWSDVPHIDFAQNNVVAIFMGQKNTGGYSINVRKVTIQDGTATLSVQRTTPGGMATMALTAPYCIVVIPKTDKVVVE
jgi:hypothetical protein